MIGSSRSYAIGMAHFRIAGGLNSLILVGAIYLFLFFLSVGLLYYFDYAAHSRLSPDLSRIIVTIVLVIESVGLILLGSSRVANAIRTDISSRMIESHRLMPIPSWRAIAGYILGANSHVLAFAAINVVLSYAFAFSGHVPFNTLTTSQAILFVFSLLLWTYTAMGTLIFRHMFAISIGALFIGGCGLGAIYVFLPGFALLIGPLLGDSIYAFSTPGYFSNWAIGASLIAQFAFIAIYFAAACRKYRGAYDAAFSPLLSNLLIAAWSIVSLAGIALWGNFEFHAANRLLEPDSVNAQVVASVLAGMMLMLVPARSLTLAAPTPKSVALAFARMSLCIGLIAMIPLGLFLSWDFFSAGYSYQVPDAVAFPASALWVTALVVAAHGYLLLLMRYALRRIKPLLAWIILVLTLVVLWALPLIIELVRIIGLENEPTTQYADFSMISTFSPAGVLITTWTASSPPPWYFGVATQWAIPVLLGLFLFGRRIRQPQTAVPIVANA